MQLHYPVRNAAAIALNPIGAVSRTVSTRAASGYSVRNAVIGLTFVARRAGR
jgi:hypothetical protein